MTRGFRSIGLAVAALVAAAALAACSGRPAAPTAAAAGGARTLVVDGGQVTVRATWLGPQAGPVFEVVLDTHAVDLDGIDLVALATLRADGASPVAPSSWDAPKGGHHRAGTLVFPATTPDGKPAIAADARSLELTVRDVAGVPERTFRWTP